MSGGESPWWSAGRSPGPDSEGVFKYPPELLGTSWGSYLFSVPPTATVPGRSEKKVVIARDTQARRPDIKQDEPPVIPSHDQCSPKRSILRAPAVKVAEACPSTRNVAIQPHPLFHRLAASLQKAQESLNSCGINSSPLSEALTAVNKTQQQAISDADESIQSCIESVLKALVSQGKKIEEYAISLQHTAAALSRNQRQFTRDQHDMQQTMEAAYSHIMSQKVSGVN